MEQDVKIGSVGSAQITEAVAGETVTGKVMLGEVIELDLTAKIDNAKLLVLVASRVPGGLAHEAVVALQKALFPSA